MPPGAKVIHRYTHACTGDTHTHTYVVTSAIVYELPQERFSVDSTRLFRFRSRGYKETELIDNNF